MVHSVEIVHGWTLNPDLTHETHSELIIVYGWVCNTCEDKSTKVFRDISDALNDANEHGEISK